MWSEKPWSCPNKDPPWPWVRSPAPCLPAPKNLPSGQALDLGVKGLAVSIKVSADCGPCACGMSGRVDDRKCAPAGRPWHFESCTASLRDVCFLSSAELVEHSECILSFSFDFPLPQK